MSNDQLLCELKIFCKGGITKIARRVGVFRHTVRNHLTGRFNSVNGVLIEKAARDLIAEAKEKEQAEKDRKEVALRKAIEELEELLK